MDADLFFVASLATGDSAPMLPIPHGFHAGTKVATDDFSVATCDQAGIHIATDEARIEMCPGMCKRGAFSQSITHLSQRNVSHF